jgi:hypothetical protein
MMYSRLTSCSGMVARSLRSAPAQNMPGVLERITTARTLASNRSSSSADRN